MGRSEARLKLAASLSGPQFAWALACALAAAYVVVCVAWSADLYGDYADHLARTIVIADLAIHQGRHFSETFGFHFMAVPYVVGDLLLTAAVVLFGPSAASAISAAAALLALPCAVLIYLHVGGVKVRTQAPLFILSLYLSTDWFFVAGFLSFRFAVALLILALALAHSLRRRWSTAIFVGYCAIAALGYLTHLAFAIFLAAALGATAAVRLWRGSGRVIAELALLLPVAGTLIWQTLSGVVYPKAVEVVPAAYEWGSLYWKLRRLHWDLVRYSEVADVMIIGALGTWLIYAARRGLNRQALQHPLVAELLALAAIFIALYLALPMRYGDAGYVDVRAMAVAIPCLLFVLLLLADGSAAGRGSGPRAVLVAISALAAGNIAYLAVHLRSDGVWLSRFRAVAASLPEGARVLPVYTLSRSGVGRPYFHDAALAVVVDHNGFIPYMFSGDQGQPQRYFRYLKRPYAPPIDWYSESFSDTVHWGAIACAYDFMLITKPYEPRRIGAWTRVSAENSAAALLVIDKRQCTGDSAPAQNSGTVP